MKKLMLTLAAATFAVAAFEGAYAADGRSEQPRFGPPYEKTEFDRTLPNVAGRRAAEESAGAGASVAPDSVWARDYNFIAPPQ